MKGNLTITVGISGSGKSTWAHDQWQMNPEGTIIVNRDKIRELLFGYTERSATSYYSRTDLSKREKQVTRFEDTLINEGLQDGKHVIVDATHLKRSYLTRFAYWNVPTEIKLFEVSIYIAVRNDLRRLRRVGKDIIKAQIGRFDQLKKDLEKNPIDFTPKEFSNPLSNKPDCILVDIDGTLAHMNGRSPYDWKRVGEDIKDHSVAVVSNDLEYRNKIIICTGRDESCLEETKKWLRMKGIFYDEMIMRKAGDQRADWIVKEEMWRKIAEDNYILGMIDDRQQVVRRARSLGLKVFNVEYNNF